MGPRELLAAVEILSAEGRVSRKIQIKKGPGFKQITHIGDKSGLIFYRYNGKWLVTMIYPSVTPKIIIKNNYLFMYSNGKTTYIQLTLKEAKRILA